MPILGVPTPVTRIKRISFACTLATWIAVSPLLGTAAEKLESTTASTFNPAKIGVDNFGRINETYYRGAQPNGRDYSDLAALGIKTVIDLQQDGKAVERHLVESAGMKFYRIPMTTHTVPTSDQLALFLQLVGDPSNQPVYVHCAGGRHRTGVMTAVYRMTHDGWTSDQAFREMKQYDFGADFLHSEFKQFVYGYHVERDRVLPVSGVVTAANAAN
jgi:protein tyrosine/serine phosphatase